MNELERNLLQSFKQLHNEHGKRLRMLEQEQATLLEHFKQLSEEHRMIMRSLTALSGQLDGLAKYLNESS